MPENRPAHDAPINFGPTFSQNLNAQLGFVKDAARQYGETQANGTALEVLGTWAYLKTALERTLEEVERIRP